jgi:hypothetical protein
VTPFVRATFSPAYGLVFGPRETRGLPVDMRGVVLDVLADAGRDEGPKELPVKGRTDGGLCTPHRSRV